MAYSPVIVVIGVPGVGKSSILQQVEDQISDTHLINYGSVMLEIAGSEEISREQLRELSIKQQLEIGRKAARQIIHQAVRNREQITIVDTHALVQTQDGFIPGLSLNNLKLIQPDALVVVEANPEFILKCRQTQSHRFNGEESVKEIAFHQELNRQYAVSCCAMVGCALHFCFNDGGDLSKIATPLIQLIQNQQHQEFNA